MKSCAVLLLAVALVLTKAAPTPAEGSAQKRKKGRAGGTKAATEATAGSSSGSSGTSGGQGSGSGGSGGGGSSSVATTSLFGGALSLSFSDPKAAPQLLKWAKALSASGGTVSHGSAAAREQKVVRMVESGEWSPQSYHEYQRFAAATGNVDSARLLLSYGLGPAVSEAVARRRQWPLHGAAAACDLPALRRALGITGGVMTRRPRARDGGDSGERGDGDGDSYDDGARGDNNAAATADDGFFVDVDAPLPDGTTALVAAALSGCEGAVELLVGEGADLESASSGTGLTPLMAASAAGEHGTVGLLLRLGASPDAKHKFAGTTALHMAAENGFGDAVEALCAGGADGDAASASTGGTPLHTASQANASAQVIAALLRPRRPSATGSAGAGSHDGVDEVQQLSKGTKVAGGSSEPGVNEVNRALFGCGANPEALLNNDTTALYLAADRGFLEVVEALLAHGARPGGSMPDDADKGWIGSKGLQPAARGGRGGSDDPDDWDASALVVNGEPANGATPLHAASEQGFPLVASALLRAGASAEDRSMRGAGPLHSVAMHGRGDARGTINVLLKQGGADVNGRGGRDGATALYFAAGLGLEDVTDALLSHGADPNAGQRRAGGTPLLYAAGMGHAGVVRRLLAVRLDATMAPRPKGGRSAADKVLIEVDLAASDGTTPLHAAASEGHADVVALLLAAGADPNKQKLDKKGPTAEAAESATTPLLLAVSAGHHAAAATLLHGVPKPRGVHKQSSKRSEQQPERSAGASRFLEVGVGADPAWTAPGTGVGALHVACQNGDLQMVQLLLDAASGSSEEEENAGEGSSSVAAMANAATLAAGAGLNATPLYLCAKVGDAAVAEACAALLLAAGANPNAALAAPGGGGGGGATALLAAIEARNAGLAKVLLGAGADPNLGAAGGSSALQSPLLYAVMVGGNALVAGLLLNHGANCAVVVGSKAEPLTLVDVARRRRDFDTLQLLTGRPDCDLDLTQHGL